MVEILDQLIGNFEIYCIESVFLRSFLPLRFSAWPPALAASFNGNAEPPGLNLPHIPEVSSFPSTPVAQSTDRAISQVVEQFTWFQGGTIRKDSTFALWGLHFQPPPPVSVFQGSLHTCQLAPCINVYQVYIVTVILYIIVVFGSPSSQIQFKEITWSAQSQKYITPRVSAKANPWNVSTMVGKSDNMRHLPTF